MINGLFIVFWSSQFSLFPKSLLRARYFSITLFTISVISSITATSSSPYSLFKIVRLVLQCSYLSLSLTSSLVFLVVVVNLQFAQLLQECVIAFVIHFLDGFYKFSFVEIPLFLMYSSIFFVHIVIVLVFFSLGLYFSQKSDQCYNILQPVSVFDAFLELLFYFVNILYYLVKSVHKLLCNCLRLTNFVITEQFQSQVV